MNDRRTMVNRFALVAVMLSVGLAFLLAGRVQAQGPTPSQNITDDEVNAIAKQLYCPVCENIPLDVCSTQACAEWREQIRDLLAEGYTEAEIKQYFVDRYGDRVLATPPARGLNWLVYVLPPVAILAGVFILYRAFRAWPKNAPEPAAGQPEIRPEDDPYIRRIEEELRRRQKSDSV